MKRRTHCRLPIVDCRLQQFREHANEMYALRDGHSAFRCFAVESLGLAIGLWAAFLILLLSGSCMKNELPTRKVPVVSRTAEGEGIRLVLSAHAAEIEVSQHLHVEIEVVADADLDVSVDDYGRALAEGDRPFQFRVVSSREDAAKPMEGKKRRWVAAYEIEFFLPDRYELPPARVMYRKTRTAENEEMGGQFETQGNVETSKRQHGDASDDGNGLTLETEPLPVEVKDSSRAALTSEELRRIAMVDPRELPVSWTRWVIAAVAVVLAAGAAVAFLRIRRRGREAAVIPIPAHEWAYAEFARLAADNLVARGLLQDYFYRVSDIVRGYVERRFHVRAPEMTTEEFLSAAAEDTRFDAMHTDELKRFLIPCDAVKYAKHEPTEGECDGVLQAARRFVERTRERLFPSAAEPTAVEPLGREQAA